MTDRENIIRIDGYEKVTGRAKYCGDLYFDRMLYGKILRSKYPHAKILNINYEKALEIKGVHGVVTSWDVPGEKTIGAIRFDHFPFATDKALYIGDGIAAVAAESEEVCDRALKEIVVDYEELPGVFDIFEAMKEDAPVVKEEFESNIMTHYPLRKGNIDEGFKNSDIIIEKEFNTQFVEHAYIETEAVIAVPGEGKDCYEIYGSIQCPHSTRKGVARTMGVPLKNIRIIQANMGGAFGGKDDQMTILAIRACVLARKTDRPVKIVYSREESIIDSYKRHPYNLKYKVGVTKDGKIQAMKVMMYADAGAYLSMTPFVTWRSVVQATGPYEVANVETDIYGIATNNPYTGAFRGFGSPQIIFAQESLMDEIAEKLGMDGVELRRINGYRQGSETASSQKLEGHTVSLMEAMDKVIEKSDYFNKKKEFAKYNLESERFKKGIGLSCSFRGCSLGAEGTDATGAIVSVQADGSVYILAGLAENGQGLKTTFSKIAADVFGIDVSNCSYLPQDTGFIADGGPTVASRSTLMGGSAVKLGAEIVRDRIKDSVKKELDAENPDNIVFENGKVRNIKNAKEIDFKKACEIAYFDGKNITAYGWYKAPDVYWDEEKGQGPAYFTYVYGSQIAELTVDTWTGKVFVDNAYAAHDVGHAVNYQGTLGQIYGGVVQGMGYGLFEEVDVQDGYIKNTNLDEYFIPTVKDFGNIHPIVIENPDKYGPWGGKSLGEPTLELMSAAINNAVSNATGKRFYKIPIDLETIVTGKQLKRKQKRGSEA